MFEVYLKLLAWFGIGVIGETPMGTPAPAGGQIPWPRSPEEPPRFLDWWIAKETEDKLEIAIDVSGVDWRLLDLEVWPERDILLVDINARSDGVGPGFRNFLRLPERVVGKTASALWKGGVLTVRFERDRKPSVELPFAFL